MSVLGVTKYEDMVVGKIYSLRNVTYQGREYNETITKYYKSETGMLMEMISDSESKVSNFSFEEVSRIWFNEVIELPKLTDDEKIILRLLSWKYKYIARDLNGKLYIYNCDEIKKQEDIFIGGDNFLVRVIFEEKFEGIKPMEGYKIEDLLGDN